MQLTRILKTILILTGLSVFYWALPAPAYAQACGGDCSVGECVGNKVCIIDGEEEVCYIPNYYCSNCGGNGCQNVGCPPGFYKPPYATGCVPIGQNLECGDWYPCKTPSNPDKMCKVECGGGDDCRAGKVDCPPGYVKTATVASTTCSVVNNQSLCGGLGSAQTSAGITATGANCCYGRAVDTDDCWIKPSGKEECASEWICFNPRITTYECVVNCNATAPTGVSASQGSSPTTANVTWTSGTNGVSQRLYVGTDQAKVNAGCPQNDCYINGLAISPFYASTSYSYPVTGLMPNTAYYFRVVTYKARSSYSYLQSL